MFVYRREPARRSPELHKLAEALKDTRFMAETGFEVFGSGDMS
jgi:hypothetical protein